MSLTNFTEIPKPRSRSAVRMPFLHKRDNPLYAAQMDTLKRYRSKGQQTMRVERVTVKDGGQAIVGNVTGERGHEEK